MELAHFYNGWTLDYIRSLSIYELDKAREYMIHEKRSQGGENGGKRYTPTQGRSNR